MSTTKEVSRRAIMSGAAALPAIAVLPAIADTTANPDAELIALGKQFEFLKRQYDRPRRQSAGSSVRVLPLL